MTILEGQHALITGGGSGIGLACAQAFLADGATVTLVGRNMERLQAAADQLGPQAYAQQADISDEQSISAAMQAANARVPLSIIVANAGTGSAGPLFDTDAGEWDRVIQTNLNGTFYTFKHGGAALAGNGGGAMCAISSIAGLRTHKLMSAYCTSKAAIDMLVRNAADELGAQQVRVNSVCPGLVVTDLSTALHETPAMRDDYLACMPIARLGQGQDIANAVRFLCGPEAAWITGAILPVDGGHHPRRGPNIEVLAGV
ncbi:MAG: glucose 1-dehydrogenase [Pseudomonadales bacterium]